MRTMWVSRYIWHELAIDFSSNSRILACLRGRSLLESVLWVMKLSQPLRTTIRCRHNALQQGMSRIDLFNYLVKVKKAW